MSFILDALKKSEIERQEQAGPSVSHVREARSEGRRPVWIAAIAALLAINILVITFFAFRNDGGARVSPDAVAPPAPRADDRAPEPPPSRPATVAESAALPGASREVRPLEAEVVPPATEVQPPAARPAPGAGATAGPSPGAPAVTAAAPDDTELLPSFNELVVAGRLALPPLHLDIHVYNDAPASRFVFIDGRKYREGERLTAGPQVERITKAGVVLSHQNERFLLPRM
ncbi:MAG TPA: general secretion pathway protein GspB [Gammaproteobacteria bacterium]|nr:general secretion pathway protein GspB [Gammaproteobacteria bacterium]